MTVWWQWDIAPAFMTTAFANPIPDRIASNTTRQTDGPQLDGFAHFFFEADRLGHFVYYTAERTDPPLLLLPEIAGFSPGLMLFVERLVKARFQVYVPWLFGPFGKHATFGRDSYAGNDSGLSCCHPDPLRAFAAQPPASSGWAASSAQRSRFGYGRFHPALIVRA